MKIKYTVSFQRRLLNQIDFIAKDSVVRARKFQRELIKKIEDISNKPFANRKSIYFDDVNIRDLIYKGYTIVYQISNDEIIVFGFVKYQSTIEDI